MPSYETCEMCGKQSADVCERADPYEEDVNNRTVWVTICDDCDCLLGDEI